MKIGLVLGVQFVILAVLLTLALDQYAHKRVEQLGGVNIWGYRGSIMPARRPEETRLMVVGGDMAFGWGVAASETMAAYLRQFIERTLADAGRPRYVTAVNAGVQGLPLLDYAFRIDRLRYLQPDVICLYVDLVERTTDDTFPAQRSAITAMTRYVPMLPVVLEEKGILVTASGSAIRGGVLTFAGRTLAGADRWAYDLVVPEEPRVDTDRQTSLARAIDTALGAAWGVTVVLPMPFDEAQTLEHAWMRAYVETRAANEPRLRVVDLALQAKLAEAGLRLDQVHFGAGGHALEAIEIAPAALDLISKVESR